MLTIVRHETRRLSVKCARDFAAGFFMIGLAILAFILSSDLPFGELGSMGPGMLPKAFAGICLGLGILQVALSFRYSGEPLSGWSWRAVLLVLGALCLFGLTIQGFSILRFDVPSLGLLVAGPLLVLVAGCAMEGFSWSELVLLAAALTALCTALFKYALNLPIPLAPWLLGF